MIRVFVADDQALVRSGLCSLLALAEDLEVAGEAADGQAALDGIAKLELQGQRVDVLLLDVRMPGMSGLDVLERLRGRPATIIVTTFPDEEALIRALGLGARGYLLKDATFEELCDAIRAVARGETSVQPVTLSRVLPGLRKAGDTALVPNQYAAPPMPLTAREKEVLRLLAGGLSNREIATALGNAEGTVKNHISNILQKLQARDRTQAVLLAVQQGLF